MAPDGPGSSLLLAPPQRALASAADAHATQRRKASDIPDIAHLLRVSALVWDHGGDEDRAIAALLHDTAEDQGGAARLADIEARFGPVVAGIVDACSDSLVDTAGGEEKAPWRERKEHHLARASTLGPQTLLVMMADKVDNAESVLANVPRSATLRALEPMDLVVIGSRQFEPLLDEVPELSRHLLVGLAEWVAGIDGVLP